MPTPRPAPDVVARRLDNAGVLVNVRTNDIFELNETGIRMWELLGTASTLGEIIEQLHREFDADVDDIEHAVQALLRDLRTQGLVE